MLTRRAVKSAAPLPLPAVPPDAGSSRPPETGAPSRETFARIAVLAEAVAQDLRQLADLARLASGAVPFSPKALAWPHVEAAPPPLLYLAIEGARIGRRSGVLANGSRVELQDSVFVALLRFARANHRAAGSWSTRGDLGLEKSTWLVSRLRCAFRGHLPEGAQFLEADRRERFRLSPVVVVEPIDPAALAMHPDATVRNLAATWST
jgi:hypothetical protein